jgi:hypothetical protein
MYYSVSDVIFCPRCDLLSKMRFAVRDPLSFEFEIRFSFRDPLFSSRRLFDISPRSGHVFIANILNYYIRVKPHTLEHQSHIVSTVPCTFKHLCLPS